MNRLTNPYTPGAGSRPAITVLPGREEELESFSALLARLEEGLTEQAPLIMGLRGVGKTVLLNAYEEIALKREWLVQFEEASDTSSLPQLLAPWLRDSFAELQPAKTAITRLYRRFGRLKSFSVTVSPTGEFTFGFDISSQTEEDDLGSDLTTILIELGQLARQRHTGCVFLLDEVQFIRPEEFSPFVKALHRLNQKALPVTFVGAGLPQLPRLVGEAKTYAERFFDFTTIGQLPKPAATDAVRLPAQARGVEWTQEAVDGVLQLSDGYPFFIQQYAKYAWLKANESPIGIADVRAGESRALEKLDEGFFQSRIQRTSERERRYLDAMASLDLTGPYQSGAVSEASGGTTTQWSDVRDSLLKKGLVFSDGHGRLDFTVPHFAAFMRRRVSGAVGGAATVPARSGSVRRRSVGSSRRQHWN